MAKINTVGIEITAKRIDTISKESRSAAESALRKAGETAAEAIRANAERAKLRDTGKLIKSIRPGPVGLNTDGGKVEVWPQGSRRRGSKTVRNALVGFVQHYGRSYGKKRRPATNFFELLPEDAEKVQRVMGEEWNGGIGKLNG